MDQAINNNDQVEYLRPIRTGTLVEIGSVVKIDGDRALVHFPQLTKNAMIPISQLRATSHRFGNIRVQPSPARRTLQNLLYR